MLIIGANLRGLELEVWNKFKDKKNMLRRFWKHFKRYNFIFLTHGKCHLKIQLVTSGNWKVTNKKNILWSRQK